MDFTFITTKELNDYYNGDINTELNKYGENLSNRLHVLCDKVQCFTRNNIKIISSMNTISAIINEIKNEVSNIYEVNIDGIIHIYGHSVHLDNSMADGIIKVMPIE